jgi:hypothetical protein
VVFIFKGEISVPVYLGAQPEQLYFLETFWQPAFTFLIHGEWTADLEKALHGTAESAVDIVWHLAIQTCPEKPENCKFGN